VFQSNGWFSELLLLNRTLEALTRMQSLAFKMLFRKKGTASAILAIALLIAMITAVDCLVNNINQQTLAVTKLARVGENYLITSGGISDLSDSQIDSNLICQIKNNSDIGYATAQKLVEASLSTNAGTFTVTVRGVDDVQAFLNNRGASINGTVCQNSSQANVGVILASLACVERNDLLNLTINNYSLQLQVAGITQSNGQSDSEIIVPLATLADAENSRNVSFIEFSLSDPNQANTALKNLNENLTGSIKITNTQQIVAFAADINNQTVVFIGIWSVAIYVVVAAASYVISTRAVNEAEYELYMLRNLGAKKHSTITLIVFYALIIAALGSVIGVSLGIVGTQLASTGIRWLWGNTQLAPFLGINQTIEILLFALAAAVIGSIYPAVRAGQNTPKEASI
jgi:ABC-type lipoprotein release transport system permease subunit